MTTQEKYDSVLALVREHNVAIDPDNSGLPGTIDPDKFVLNLKAFGAITEEDLKKLSYEDILSCLKPSMNKSEGMVEPKGLAKKIANLFRSGEKTENEPETKYVSSKKADKMSPKELVDHYDSLDATNAVAKRLQEVSKGQAFIIFHTDKTVHTIHTLSLLNEIRNGFPGRDIFSVDGIPQKVYKVGEVPNNEVDENPVFPGRPLRPDGTCDQTNRSWAGVTNEMRQFVCMIAQKDMPVNVATVHYLLDLILGASDAEKKLIERFPKVWVSFAEAKQKGNLPRLKIAIGNQKEGQARPFDDGRQVVWYQPEKANYYQTQTFNTDAPVEWRK